MLAARIIFDLQTVYDRINETIPEYEKSKPIRQEHITEIKFNKRKKNIEMVFNTYAYEITHPDEIFIISWFHKSDTEDGDVEYIKDGFVECNDLAVTVRTVLDYMYGGFCPARSYWWMLHDKPKRFSRNVRWGP